MPLSPSKEPTDGGNWGQYMVYEGTLAVPANVDGEMVSVDIIDSTSGRVVDEYNHFRKR